MNHAAQAYLRKLADIERIEVDQLAHFTTDQLRILCTSARRLSLEENVLPLW